MNIKNHLIAAFVIVMGCISCSSEMDAMATDIPPAVTEAFKAKYPDAKDVKWEVEKKGDNLVYEVDFEIGNDDKEAHFSADGTQLDE